MIAGRCKNPTCRHGDGWVYATGKMRGLCGEKCLTGFFESIRRPCRTCVELERHIRAMEARLEEMAMQIRVVHAENESLRAGFVQDSVLSQTKAWS